jgi:hypothetical protein
MQRSQEAPAHAVDPSQSETKPACQARRSTESPTTHPAGAADNDRSMHMPPCPSGQMHPHNRNARAVHAQAQPQCPSGPRHQDTHATITPQCPSGPWTRTAAMPERLRDNHHTAMPERSKDKRSRNARAAQGQPRTRHTAMPRTSTAAMPERPRDTYTASTPQCPSGPCKQSAMPDRPRSNNGGEHQG